MFELNPFWQEWNQRSKLRRADCALVRKQLTKYLRDIDRLVKKLRKACPFLDDKDLARLIPRYAAEILTGRLEELTEAPQETART